MKKLGFTLILLSFLLYILIFFLPFMPFTLAQKGLITTVLIVLGEISFWAGGIILGKEYMSKIKNIFNFRRIFKSKKHDSEQHTD